MGFNSSNFKKNDTVYDDEYKRSKGERVESNEDKGSRSWYTAPNGVKYHKWTKESERFNILFARDYENDEWGDHNPYIKHVHVHELPNIVDPNGPGRKYVCLRDMPWLGLKCPCCERKEEINQRYEDMGEDPFKNSDCKAETKPFLPKERVLTLINPEGTDEVHVVEGAAFMTGNAAFVQRLNDQAVACADGEGIIKYARPNEDGRIVKITTAEGKHNGHSYFLPATVNFFPRKELPAEELYDKCGVWKDYLNVKVQNGYKNIREEMMAYIDGTAGDYTDEQKQDEFEKACDESINNVSQPKDSVTKPSENVGGFTESDFNEDQYKKNDGNHAETSKACPEGFAWGKECDTHRACLTCAHYDECHAAQKAMNK